MNKTIYFIGKEIRGSRFNPYFVGSTPIIAVADTLEMAQKFCQNQINRIKNDYKQSGFFTPIETHNPLTYSCKYDYQNKLTLKIRKEVVTEEKYNRWFNNPKPYYFILK